MDRMWRFGWVCCLLLAGVLAVAAGQVLGAETEEGPATVTAGDARIAVDPKTGNVTSILLSGKEELASPHPNGSEIPFGYLEILDQRDRRTYNPLAATSTISDWKVSGDGDARRISFIQQYENAPFRIVQTMRGTPAGLRWEASVRLLDGQKENRSVQVTWVLPLPVLWKFWGPSGLDVHDTNGVIPYRYIYGHTDASPMATIIPLVGIWSGKAGAAVFSPPDVRKSQIIFEVQTQGLTDVGTGAFRHVEDLQSLRVAHHMVGLRPGKDLNLAICIAGCRPDWRGVLGYYVNAYPELFEPIPEARKYEGMYGITVPKTWWRQQGHVDNLPIVAARATCVEMHGHFIEYGYYINEEIISNPDKEFACRPHLQNGPNTYAKNRRTFREMLDKGIAPFVYFYNVHCLPDTSARRFPGEMMMTEQGRPAIQWYTESTVVGQPDSAFGKNLLEQIQMLIDAYPEAPGFFVDNYSIQRIDFAHDDGVTMVHNKPCYDLNRNHQDIGTRCNEIAHKARKVMMVNQLATIESAKGADMVLAENADTRIIMIHALACPNRSFFPLMWEHPDKAHWSERGLQVLLAWGGTPAVALAKEDNLETVQAYRPLTDAMIGKRLVLDADPLTLPAGYEGQIFRIDPHAPRAGDVVVSMVDMTQSWKTPRMKEDLSIVVRLPEAEQLTKVTWLGVEKSREEPVICRVTREGRTITAQLPPVGAAGILRLSRPVVK